MSNFTFNENVPFRGSCQPLKYLEKFFKNKDICDLGCGSGDLMGYIKYNFNPKSIKGVDNNYNRYKIQKEKYDLNILNINISQFDFQNENIDTFYLWIEQPDTEIFVINKLKSLNKKCNIIIAYNIMGNCRNKFFDKSENYNSNCGFCSYLRLIPDKILKVKNYLINNKIKYVDVDIDYNDGNNCRQQGIIKYFVIAII